MFLQQKVQYPWALEENTQLECGDVNKIGSEDTQEIRVSREWCKSEMSVSGERTGSQNNWRHSDSNSKHKNSGTHNACQKTKRNTRANVLESTL